MTKINATAANRKVLRNHAKEAITAYSAVMTWLVQNYDADLYEIVEPQGQSVYTGSDDVIATTGGFHKSHGDGAAVDQYGKAYKTQRDYLSNLLGAADYKRIF